jgi:hypothetical protein
MEKLFSVLIGCYGDFARYSLRAVNSLFDTPAVRDLCDIHVGCNACCASTVSVLRNRRSAGEIDTLIESGPNLNKDPMMRLLIGVTQTPFLVWMDDDSWILPQGLNDIQEYIEAHLDLDVAGHVFFYNREPSYQRLAEARPWWQPPVPGSQREKKVHFATGGLFIARTDFLRRHNFPDRNMVKKFDDILLGDLMAIKGARLCDFSRSPVMKSVRISDGHRRGFGEGQDGYVSDQIATSEL